MTEEQRTDGGSPEPLTPLGHFTPAHEAFGWCCLCRNRDELGELLTWRSAWMRDHGHASINMDAYAQPMGNL